MYFHILILDDFMLVGRIQYYINKAYLISNLPTIHFLENTLWKQFINSESTVYWKLYWIKGQKYVESSTCSDGTYLCDQATKSLGSSLFYLQNENFELLFLRFIQALKLLIRKFS